MNRAMQSPNWKHAPVFTPLIEQRSLCLVIAGALGAHMSLLILDLPSFQCPIRQATGMPCPGCGLSRAIQLLMGGAWRQSLDVHAFAAPVLAALAIMAVSLLLPSHVRTRLVARIGQLERFIPFGAFGLVSIVMYWLFRLIWMREAYYHLIR
jgi:hypothetical protein